LLGIVEKDGQEPLVELLVGETSQRLGDAGITYDVEMESGRGSVVIARHAASGKFLTVAGPLGRPAWRRALQGRSFRRLLEKVETPLLYVPQARLPLKKLLLCMGGLDYALGVERVAAILAKAAGATVTILHVVEPANLDYPIAREVHTHWQTILETNTPAGRSLRGALQELQAAQVSTTVKVRQGSAVHEILDEIRAGEYDLAAMGSPYSGHSLRHLYMPNVTAEVAETARLPVLTVRQGHELSA
jgi:nucleotide-binding universal stress UspA family protein